MSDRPTRDCQCKRANHQHGTRTAYVVDRCRCDPCREAARIYEAQLADAHERTRELEAAADKAGTATTQGE